MKRKFTLLLIIISLGIAYSGNKFEPPDGKVLHGAQAEVRPVDRQRLSVDWKGIDDYAAAAGAYPKLIMHYISLDSDIFYLLLPTIAEIAKQDYDYYAQIGLDFYTYPEGNGFERRRDISHEILSGKHDSELAALASLFKEMEIPVFLRPGYEFGGKGFGSRYSRKLYVRVWKYLVDYFRKQHVENVAFVWNTVDEKKYMGWYPGDDYVDWWAINIFQSTAFKDSLLVRFTEDAARHQKPLMIAESTPHSLGVVSAEKVIKEWFTPYFEFIHRYPNVKAFCYINASWLGYPDRSFWYECRIQTNPQVAAFYRRELANKRYINALPKLQQQMDK